MNVIVNFAMIHSTSAIRNAFHLGRNNQGLANQLNNQEVINWPINFNTNKTSAVTTNPLYGHA